MKHRNESILPSSVEYPIASLNAVKIELSDDPSKKRTIKRLQIDGQEVVPTDRFVTSLTSNLGMNGASPNAMGTQLAPSQAKVIYGP